MKPISITENKKISFQKESKESPFPVVAIGASAGGLEAVTQLFQNLSPDTGMAFIYVQHLSPDHKSILTQLLAKTTKMKVQEIEEMDKMKPDNVYVMPYNKGIEVKDGHIQLVPRSNSPSANSIDILFSSLAETHKENVVGIVLSGSAGDGTHGLKDIKEAGGITFVQDDSAKFTSMPQSAIAAGVADFVLSPKEIAKELTWMSKHPLLKRKVTKRTPEDEIENDDPHLKIILRLLHKRKGVDFSHYKMSTIKRRMLRRMLIHKIKTLKQYAGFLGQKNNEVELLHQDLLINVTDFFRDAEAFQFLKTTVLPRLLKSKAQGETIRIWVAACATGEEVYSIAMMLLEIQDNKTSTTPFQIFASDLSAEAISIARIGEYSMPQLKNVSPKRLQRFFVKSRDKYRISKSLRDVCVFAHHNILRDPPFSRMDFISCRNLLIYLDTSAQKKAIATFHYALNDEGCLLLGKSETIGTAAQLFSPLSKKFKIYSRKKNSGSRAISDMAPRFSDPDNGSVGITLPEKKNTTKANHKKIPATTNSNLTNTFDSILLSRYMPASVIISHDMEVLEFRGSTELYLKHSSGKASFNILKMARPEIIFELRNAIHHAIKTKKTICKTGIEIKIDSALRIVNLEVSPLKIEVEEPLLLVVFTEQQHPDNYLKEIAHATKGGKNNSIVKDRRIKKLEEELAAARSDMGAITHDQEAANEELQSANEEIVSSNEEMQSLNEELETSKEEIESTNEELTTSNQELHARIQQVEELYNYSEAILSTIHEPMLILDKDIRIKSANKAFCKLFHVTEEDTIGISLFKLGNNQWNIPRLRELLEDIIPKNIRFHDFEVEHTFSDIGHKIMLLNAHRVIQQSQNEELIVLAITDVTEVRTKAGDLQAIEKKALAEQRELEKKAMKQIEESEKQLRELAELMPQKVWTSDAEGNKKYFNQKWLEYSGMSLEELKDWGWEKIIHPDDWEETKEKWEQSISTGNDYEMENRLLRKDGKYLWHLTRAVAIKDSNGKIKLWIGSKTEIQEQREQKEELIEARKIAEHKTEIAEDVVKAKQQFLSNMSHEIRTPMNSIIGFTNVVLKTDLNKEQKEYIHAIKTSGDALLVLINDILDLAKVDSGKMRFEQIPFNLFESISSMLLVFENKIQEKNLELVKDYGHGIPENIEGDPMRLRQIILNLVSNSVKFTEVGKIILSIHKLKEDAEKITIKFSVTDTGIGIPEDKLENVFEDFQQVAYADSKLYGGTGLGLSIVKQLVERQGGAVTVKSKVGQGSTFSFTLSFKKTKTTTTTTTTDGTESAKLAKNIKILVVEDMPLNQLLIKTLLIDFGVQFDIAGNGKIAIEKLQKNKYDIVLMDLQMPEMNGFEATKYIRNEMNSQIPIIALTADVTSLDVEKSKAIGMNDYISKPIDEKILYSKIIKYLKKSD